MRYRVITLILGISLTAAAVSGCGRNLNPEKPESGIQTEPQSIKVMDMEVVPGAEDAGQTEKTAQAFPEEGDGTLPDEQGTGQPENGSAGEGGNMTDTGEKTPSVGRIWQGITTPNTGEEEEPIIIEEDEAGTAGTAVSSTGSVSETESAAAAESESGYRAAVSGAEASGADAGTESSFPEEYDEAETENPEDAFIEIVNEDGTVAEFENEEEPAAEEPESDLIANKTIETAAGNMLLEEPESDLVVDGTGEAAAGNELTEESESESESGTEEEPGSDLADGVGAEVGNELTEESESESESGTEEESESDLVLDETGEAAAGDELTEDLENESEPEELMGESEGAEEPVTEEEPESDPADEAGETAAGNELTEESENESESGTEEEPKSDLVVDGTGEAAAGNELTEESENESESGTEEEPESDLVLDEAGEAEAGDVLTEEPENESESEPKEPMSESEGAEEPATEEEPESDPADETGETETGNELSGEPESESESETEPETEPETEEVSFYFGASANRVNVRAGASTDTESKALLRPGNKVIILENREDGWSMVKYESDTGIDAGYVKTEYLVPAEQLRVVAENVNVRSEPNSDSEDNKIGKFEGGEEVPVLDGGDGEWSKIAFEKDGAVETAYVKSEFLSEYNYLDSDSAIVAEYKNMLAGEGQNVDELMAGLAEEAEVSAAETPAETEASVEESGLPPWPKDPVEAQFKLAQWLVPDLGTVGIIYTRGNQETRELAGVYKDTAEKYNMELVEATVTSLEDIDFAAAELVGEVYGILIIDDEIVNSAVNIVTAYADEVGIPVIGSSEEQVKNGCAAAVDNGTVYFSQGELDKLGISLNLDQ